MYYTDNDIRLYHSAKGSTWKKHKYISKTGTGESARYKYANVGDAIKDWSGADERERMKEASRGAQRAEEGQELAYQNAQKHLKDLQELEQNGKGLGTAENDAARSELKADTYYYNYYGDRAQEYRSNYDSASARYANTPLGRAENAVNKGKEAINNALSSLNNKIRRK